MTMRTGNHDHLLRALLRGRFMGAVATMEDHGIPIDESFYVAIREHRVALQHALIANLDHLGFYVDGTFSAERFHRYITARKIDWPTTASGAYELKKETLKDMLLGHPEFKDFYDLRAALACLKDVQLTVGSDGRARTALWAYQSKTSRCQPSTTGFVFGWPRVLRRLIQPAPGRALAYVDVGQEEFAIAAVLSGDQAMQEAYRSGDCYLAFAKLAKAAPPEATKHSHKAVRERYKTVVLAVQYLMSEFGLARRLGITPMEALGLITQHRKAYATYWQWSNTVLSFARMYGYLESPHGWRLSVTKETKVETKTKSGSKQESTGTKDRTIRNWLMQTVGAELMRLACQYALLDGVMVCAPIHDALLIESDIVDINAAVTKTIAAWQRAGRELLSGFELRVDAKVFAYPARFVEDDGESALLRTIQDVLMTKTNVLHGG